MWILTVPPKQIVRPLKKRGRETSVSVRVRTRELTESRVRLPSSSSTWRGLHTLEGVWSLVVFLSNARIHSPYRLASQRRCTYFHVGST